MESGFAQAQHMDTSMEFAQHMETLPWKVDTYYEALCIKLRVVFLSV